MDCIWQLEMTSSVAGLRRSSKALAKAKFAPTKRSCSGFGGLLPVWSTTAFWILMKPLYLRSMLSKLMRCTRTSVPTASIGQQKGLNSQFSNCMLYNQHFKSWMNWAARFCLILCIYLTSCQLNIAFSSVSTNFAGKSLHNQQEAEKSFQEYAKS